MSELQQDISMYGWLENTTTLNDIFLNTKPFDIVFRSALENNSLILGNNSNTNAAIYINNNNVGIKKTPSIEHSLDINGSANMPVINNNTITVASNITCGTECTINNYGIIENNLIITKNVKNVSNSINNATIVSILQLSVSEYEVEVQFASIQDYLSFSTGSYIRINGIIYEIKNKVNNTKFILTFVNQQITPFPLTVNQTIDIDIIDEIYKQQSPNTAVAFINIQSFTTLSTSKTAFLVTISSGIDNLMQNHYYTFEGDSIGKNIYYMSHISLNDQQNDVYEIHLEKSDNTNFDISQFPFSIEGYSQVVKMSLLDAESMYELNESDVSYSNISSNEFTLSKQSLTESLVLKDLLDLSDTDIPLDTIKLIGQSDTTSIKLTGYDFTSNVFTSNDVITGINDQTINIGYSLFGIPLQIMTVDNTTNSITFKDDFNQQRKIRINDTLYVSIHNIYLDVLDIDYANNTIWFGDTIPTFIQNKTGKYIYVVPYRNKSILRISSDDCFIGKKLAIGTETAWETLTVRGDIGIQTGSTTYRDGSNNDFSLRYNDGIFDIGGRLQLGDSETTIYNNTFIRGNCYAENFFNYSDRRIKDNIVKSTFENDRNIVENTNVIEYTNKFSKQYTKGFIAQEVEKILPYAVKSDMGVLRSICKDCTVTDSGYIVLANLSEDEKVDLTIGTPIHFNIGTCSYVSPITYINKQNTSIYIKLAKEIDPNTTLFVIGPYTTIKSVNYDTMFVSVFNCVKTLLKDVADIKKVLHIP